MVNLGNDWDSILGEEFEKEYYLKIREFLKSEYRSRVIFPPMFDIFNALKYTSYKDTRVVILGQDPYHEVGQAHGLSFSVKRGIKIPPSLVNIYKELNTDIGMAIPKHGELTSWATQGVLLLNATLTVRQGQANSHQNIGWSIFTDEVIKKLNERSEPVVFILWGGNARSKKKYITNKHHLIIESAHPSPLSAYNGFFGSRPFSRANEFLKVNNLSQINWNSVNE
ncbi:MAG: uracil-DNA glycosylase [Ruminococcaceae bacterium]|nr:uracil-DNA glycosylase [Oscillospiraceae bacterium]